MLTYRCAGDVSVDTLLVARIAELDDDVTTRCKTPGIVQKAHEEVVKLLTAVRFADRDDRERVQRTYDSRCRGLAPIRGRRYALRIRGTSAHDQRRRSDRSTKRVQGVTRQERTSA
jgi:hypothetical protein